MNIVIGISGSIAACKIPDLISMLRKAGHEVRVVLTKNAKTFITPLTCQALSGQPVYDTFETGHSHNQMDHISLARWCDLLLIAPASANIISKCAHGLADDLLSTLFLVTHAPVFMAPAMNPSMWAHTITQANVAQLKSMHVNFLGPAHGILACGEYGDGRLLDIQTIFDSLIHLPNKKLYAGKQVLITAGPTRESIDAVRYLSNHSSGKMGIALAHAFACHGAQVTLVLGPTTIDSASNQYETISVKSAQNMYDAVMQQPLNQCDIFIAAAAVADYTPSSTQQSKIKKTGKPIQFDLKPTKDILHTVAHHDDRPKLVIGFAAETSNLVGNAVEKMKRKNCDLMIANQVNHKNNGMGQTHNEVVLISELAQKTIPSMHKTPLAFQLLVEIHRLTAKHHNNTVKN